LAGGGELVSGRFAIGPIIDHSQHFRLSSGKIGSQVIPHLLAADETVPSRRP